MFLLGLAQNLVLDSGDSEWTKQCTVRGFTKRKERRNKSSFSSGADGS